MNGFSFGFRELAVLCYRMADPYEAQGIFDGVFTLSELQALLTEAKAVFLEQGGSQVSTWASAGSSVTKRINLTADQVIAECMYALRILDPATYPVVADSTTLSFQ